MRRMGSEVVEGQRFRRRLPGGGVWEVVTVRSDASGRPHVQLRRTDEPHTTKTLSVSALTDGSLFEPE
jgi:hypothetical protein